MKDLQENKLEKSKAQILQLGAVENQAKSSKTRRDSRSLASLSFKSL